jgi:DNA-binding transcriptional regulator YiaG
MNIKEMRQRTGLSQADFSMELGIPWRTVQNWELGTRACPEYLIKLIDYYLNNSNLYKS